MLPPLTDLGRMRVHTDLELRVGIPDLVDAIHSEPLPVESVLLKGVARLSTLIIGLLLNEIYPLCLVLGR